MLIQNKSHNLGKQLRGITHVHTTFSHDGEISIERLAEICTTKNLNFVLIAEHAQDLDLNLFARLVDNANRLSTNSTLLIPGLEYEGENDVHLLAFGVSSFIDPGKKLIEIAGLVRKQGGLNVIAHPKRNRYFVPNDLVDWADGVEIWNSKMDGSFAPNAKSLSFLQSLRVRNAKVHGYAGLDLHWDKQKIMVFINIFGVHLQKEALFRALQNGNFTASNAFLNLEADGGTSVFCNRCFALANAFNNGLTSISKTLYHKMKKLFGNKIAADLRRCLRLFLY